MQLLFSLIDAYVHRREGGRDVKFRREATLVVGNEVFKRGELVSGGGAYVLDH